MSTLMRRLGDLHSAYLTIVQQLSSLATLACVASQAGAACTEVISESKQNRQNLKQNMRCGIESWQTSCTLSVTYNFVEQAGHQKYVQGQIAESDRNQTLTTVCIEAFQIHTHQAIVFPKTSRQS